MRRHLAPLLLLGLLAAPLSAQGSLRNHDSDAPVDVSSDSAEIQDKANRAILTGNVQVRQGDLTLRAPRMTANYVAKGGGDPEIQRLDAAGGVTLTSPTETARSNFAIYDLNRRIVTMLGGVTLTRGTNTVSGGRLVYDLSAGRASMDGTAVGGGGTRSRVQARFSAPTRAQTSPPAKK